MNLKLKWKVFNLRKYLKDPLFYVILAFKLILALFLASDILTKGFAPFVSHFVTYGFENPYSFFSSQGQEISFTGFPYPSLMLWILSIPKILLNLFTTHLEVSPYLEFFIYRIPIVVADILIYLILCYWVPIKQRQILLCYWASPLLIYINYFHGQLDVLPIAALFLSLFFLFRKNYFWSFLTLGLSFAIKTSIFAALPFYILYLFVNKITKKKIFLLALLSLSAFIVLISPYLFSPSFIDMVFKNGPQDRIFLLDFPYHFQSTKLLLAPAAYFILLFRFLSFPKINKDMFLLILGLAFSVLIIFVPPMAGWFYWAVPFLVYFYVKAKGVPLINLWMLNIFYLLYFIFRKDSDFFESFQLISPNIAALASPNELLFSIGINGDTISNLLFTALVCTMGLNIIWCYKIGIYSNFQYKPLEKPILIGISGDSGSGKTTFANSLAKLFGGTNSLYVDGDDIHKWARGDENWQIFTHLNPRGNNLHMDRDHAIALRDGLQIERVHYDHKTGKFTKPERIKPNNFIFFVGLHSFYLKNMRNIFDLKIYIDPDEVLRKLWKIRRDTKERAYSKEKVLEQLEKRSDDSKKHIKPQREHSDIIINYLPANELSNNENLDLEIPLKLRLYLENSLNIDPLLEELKKIETLKISHTDYEDLSNQSMEFEGTISAKTLNEISFRLIPNIMELLHDNLPEWDYDYQGICQLVVLYHLSENLKFKSNE